MGYRVQYSGLGNKRNRVIRFLPALVLLLALFYRIVMAADHPVGAFAEVKQAFASLDSLIFQLKEEGVFCVSG